MKRIISIIFLLAAVALHAQQPAVSLQDKVESLLSDPALEHALVGVCVRGADGRTLADVNAGRMLLPASNMKLITTGAALHAFGSEKQFETSLGYDGAIEDGVLRGDLYIIGGGDPTLASKDSIAVALETVFAQWEAIIRSAGIKSIEGRVIGDGRWFDDPMAEEPSWQLDDAGTYYGTGTSGLMFYENMQSFAVSAGAQAGDPVNIRPSYPEAPWMEFVYSCTTGEKGTGDQLYLYATDLAPVAQMRGTFAVDRAAKTLDCANKFPEYTCAYYFCKYMNDKGIACAGGPSDLKLSVASGASELTLLGSTFSPTLDRIAFETNHASNNLYAESLLRSLGKELRTSACYDSSYVALNDVLEELAVDVTAGARVKDGSGLSRQNYISPDFMCRFLDAMADSPEYEAFLYSMPFPGGNGTLQTNMKGQPEELRRRIRVKSGSMNGVRCYSGYVLPSASGGETLAFSIMTNNCTAPTWKVRSLLDKVMMAIASEN